ncbi:hypothetical protein CYMTET_9223 [Cymbomonas tetramitiformis]|uniref:Uncharacterized protein n=1 Tax=Cymbomonas tetramitiformis TaxID=36881 RepID=A0AAE0GRL7_9CHLO|nr:hypothetical protein CYMTET_9223 [Cymbomonas tetramitiformis]
MATSSEEERIVTRYQTDEMIGALRELEGFASAPGGRALTCGSCEGKRDQIREWMRQRESQLQSLPFVVAGETSALVAAGLLVGGRFERGGLGVAARAGELGRPTGSCDERFEGSGLTDVERIAKAAVTSMMGDLGNAFKTQCETEASLQARFSTGGGERYWWRCRPEATELNAVLSALRESTIMAMRELEPHIFPVLVHARPMIEKEECNLDELPAGEEAAGEDWRDATRAHLAALGGVVKTVNHDLLVKALRGDLKPEDIAKVSELTVQHTVHKCKTMDEWARGFTPIVCEAPETQHETHMDFMEWCKAIMEEYGFHHLTEFYDHLVHRVWHAGSTISINEYDSAWPVWMKQFNVRPRGNSKLRQKPWSKWTRRDQQQWDAANTAQVAEVEGKGGKGKGGKDRAGEILAGDIAEEKEEILVTGKDEFAAFARLQGGDSWWSGLKADAFIPVWDALGREPVLSQVARLALLPVAVTDPEPCRAHPPWLRVMRDKIEKESMVGRIFLAAWKLPLGMIALSMVERVRKGRVKYRPVSDYSRPTTGGVNSSFRLGTDEFSTVKDAYALLELLGVLLCTEGEVCIVAIDEDQVAHVLERAQGLRVQAARGSERHDGEASFRAMQVDVDEEVGPFTLDACVAPSRAISYC